MERKIVFILFLIFCYFSFFLRLTSYPLLMWDESRFAVNAFELTKSNNWIVITYDGIPDLWNTKPPLSIWVMAVFMKCFGFSDLVVRLPSAIAATITAISIYRFVYKHLNNIAAAFFSGMVLASSLGYIGMHVARTGDADSLTVLFITLFAIHFYNAFSKSTLSEPDKRELYLSCLFFALALLTKSSYALFILPGVFTYIIVTREWKILKKKHLYTALALSFLPLITYYALRENQNPGYIRAVWVNDLGGRLLQTIENHSHPFEYYFIQLLNHRFFYWFYFVPVGLLLLFKDQNKNENRLIAMTALSGFSILMVVSISKTKLDWYDAAVYPFFAIVCGIVLYKIAEHILSALRIKNIYLTKIFYLIFFVFLFFYPYRKVLSYINIKPGEAAYIRLKYGPFMKQLYKRFPADTVMFYENAYNSQLLYYAKALNDEGKIVKIIPGLDQAKEGVRVATCVPELKAEIRMKHQTEIIDSDKYCTCYRILK